MGPENGHSYSNTCNSERSVLGRENGVPAQPGRRFAGELSEPVRIGKCS